MKVAVFYKPGDIRYDTMPIEKELLISGFKNSAQIHMANLMPVAYTLYEQQEPVKQDQQNQPNRH
jgi:hypothetical protein